MGGLYITSARHGIRQSAISNRDRLIAGDLFYARPRRPTAAALFALVERQGGAIRGSKFPIGKTASSFAGSRIRDANSGTGNWRSPAIFTVQ
jgi:hypothetical protein